MKLFDKLDKYLVDNEYKVIITQKGVHIINYVEIEDFSSMKVVVKYVGGITTLLGTNLVISKMLDDELFIIGNLNSVEYK